LGNEVRHQQDNNEDEHQGIEEFVARHEESALAYNGARRGGKQRSGCARERL
jgi:hypothetical protein